MPIEQWLREWADQCKGHNFALVEQKLREAVSRIETLKRTAKAFDSALSENCDCEERDALRAAYNWGQSDAGR